MMMGTILGKRYHIVGRLGGGGFGQTYLAEDLYLPGKPACIVKHFCPQATDPEALATARRLFDQEAQVLYKLGKHPRIPRLLAHLEVEQEFYLVQEFIEGHALTRELVTGKPWTEAAVVTLLQDILDVLEFVHQQRIIHRDVKPSNLIRCQKDGKIALIDFGAVKQVHSQMGVSQGQSNLTIAIGSPGYMANEQLAGKPKFSSDIYSVGIIGIQALTGLHPKQLPRHVKTSELIWRDYAQARAELLDVLDRMVRYDFRDRYPSVTEVLHALSQLTASSSLRETELPDTVLYAQSEPYQSALQQGITCLERQPAQALKLFEQASQCQPDADGAWYWQGRALHNLARYEAAIAVYDKALHLQPDNAAVWYWRGGSLARLGRYEEAAFCFHQTVQLQPDYFDAWYWRGRSLHQRKRYDEAIACYEQATRLQPDSYDVWYWRGQALAELKQYDEALLAYDRAIALNAEFQLAINERDRLSTKFKPWKWRK